MYLFKSNNQLVKVFISKVSTSIVCLHVIWDSEINLCFLETIYYKAIQEQYLIELDSWIKAGKKLKRENPTFDKS